MSELIATTKLRDLQKVLFSKQLSRDLLKPLSIYTNYPIFRNKIAYADVAIVLPHSHVDQINETFSFYYLSAWSRSWGEGYFESITCCSMWCWGVD